MALGLIALGSNLGDRAEQLRRAVAALANLPQGRLAARSDWHETAPVGGPGEQGPFLNGAALVETSLTAAALHGHLRRIETALGRTRGERWAARSVDLDLLLYGDAVIESAELEAPHPRMAQRRFVLEPAAEIAPWMVHPESGWTLAALLRHLDDGADVIAVATADRATADRIVAALLEEGARLGRGAAGPQVVRWTASEAGSHAPRPKLLLAVRDSAGVDARSMRTMLHLPATGPVAWIRSADAGMHEALAAMQSIWPSR